MIYPDKQRFEGKFCPEAISGCWLWIAYTQPGGYGQFFYDGRMGLAHRWSYEHYVGPIPEGLTLDHLCRHPSCVNPEHLEPVTMRENVLRGNGVCAKQARQTHCKRGHEFDSANTHVRLRGTSLIRVCRACDRLRGSGPKRVRA